MAYQATVLPIMIASPGDVYEEREIVREVVYTWNYIHSSYHRIILMPVGWETHSSPELGERPQKLINDRILKDCDILIGVFWTRIGSPTGESISGTVEEIEEHIKSGKPALIYFSSKPVAPQSIDPVQFEALQKFKEKLKGAGLIESFDNPIDFKEKLSTHIQLCLNNNQYLKDIVMQNGKVIVGAKHDTSTEKKATKDYLSEQAKVLLKTASKDQNGIILKIAVIGGKFIQVGGQTFGGQSGRESARWEHALKELCDYDLAVAKGHKGEVFELTHKGWQVADSIVDI